MNTDRLARLLALVAGALDFSTGLGLAIAPGLTLPLMLVPVPGAEALVFLRFVGAFVAAVGASYLWALLAPSLRLRAVFGMTILFRVSAGSFVLAAVLLHWLSPLWLSVTATDYGLVLLQSWFLRHMEGKEEAE
jgi:hypothetical protein